MKKWTVILIAVIIILIILIFAFNNYDATPGISNYSYMDTQMKKLWY